MSTLFTKIITGEIPSHKVYEDELVYAFLDIYPLTEGHTLVVPKLEVERFEELPEAEYKALWAAVRKIAKRLREVYRESRVCVKIEGFDVPHVHVHVFACNNPDDFRKMPDATKKPDHVKLTEVAKKVAL